jgi:sterol desaturase/sphingolipid hydroxylase (fatty acid hydroxylase superfamily)
MRKALEILIPNITDSDVEKRNNLVSTKRHICIENEVYIMRLCTVAMMGIAMMYIETIDEWFVSLYTWLLKQPLYRWDSFEILQSTLSFMLWITLFFIFDFHIPSMRKYRINIMKGKEEKDNINNDDNRDHIVKEELLAWKGRGKAIYQEVVWYTVPWMVLDYFFPRRDAFLSAFPTAPDSKTVLFQVLCSVITYDVFFYFGHYIFHKFNISTHNKHHESGGTVRAIDAVRHTFWDGTFDVFCSVFALKFVGSHPLCRLLHNIVVTYLITEAHSGYVLPWSLSQVIPEGIVLSASNHQEHHDNGRCNYGKFFTILDRIFGTFRVY